MKTEDINDILKYSIIYSTVLKDNKTYNLKEYSEEIKSKYNFFTDRTKLVCQVLEMSEGEIIVNRYGSTFLKFKKQ